MKPSKTEKRKLDFAWIMETVGCLHANFNKEMTSDGYKTPGTWTAFNCPRLRSANYYGAFYIRESFTMGPYESKKAMYVCSYEHKCRSE